MAPAPHDAPRILVVEDEEALAAVYPDMLRGAVVDVSMTLVDARARLATGVYSGVVVDLGLPDGSGWELVEQAIARDIRVVIASAMLGAGDEARAKSLGVPALSKLLDFVQVRRALGLNATGPIERDQVLQAYIELGLRRYAKKHELAHKETAVLIAHRTDLTPEDLRARLGMSKSTIDTHRQSIRAKTGFHRVEYAVIAALEEALGRALRR